MTNEKTFDEIVSEAPLATNEGTSCLVGALQRSREAGRFVLILGDSRNVTLNVSDVRDYQILGSMVGQSLVSVTVDNDKVPDGIPSTWRHETIGVIDNGFAKTIVGREGAQATQFGLNGPHGFDNGGDPFYYDPAPMTAFALATPHQAPTVGIGERHVVYKVRYDHTSPHWDH